MRKVNILLLFFVELVLMSVFTKPASACWGDYVCAGIYRRGTYVGTKCGCVASGSNSNNPGTPVLCGPGKYACYSYTQGNHCCNIGVSGGGGGGGGSCNTTAPTNLAVAPVSPTKATVTWTKGANGVSQSVYVGSDKTKVQANCPNGIGPGSGCVVNATGIGSSLQTYTTGDALVPGTAYYWRVATFKSASCSSNSATSMALSSCLVSPSNLTISIGDTSTLTTNVNSSSEIGSTLYTPSGTFVSVNPGTDNSYPYSTKATGVSAGSGTVTSAVRNPAGATMCSASANINVIPPSPWWQVQDSDINSNGDLNSQVRAGNFFDLAGLGGYPGVPSFTSSTNLTGANVSPLGWIADSDNLDQKTYDYQYFVNQIPKDILPLITSVPSENIDGAFFESGGTADSNGFIWYKYDGSVNGLDLTLTSAMNIGSRKVILLVDSANFYINAPINLTDGQGFFMVAVGQSGGGGKGNIFVDPGVGGASPDLEGLYEADGQFKSGAGSSKLSVRGSVTAYDGILLQRDLGAANDTTPAEFFEFAPDQIMLFPSKLGVRKINWQEVAP